MANVSAEQEIFMIKVSRAQQKLSMSQRQGYNVSVVGSHQANETVTASDYPIINTSDFLKWTSADNTKPSIGHKAE